MTTGRQRCERERGGRQQDALHCGAPIPHLVFVGSVLLLGSCVVELLLDGLLEEPDWSLELPVVPEVEPLIDELPEVPGVALLEELGLVGSVAVDEELGEDGVVVADGVDDRVLVSDLLRSQPATAAVATASTATRGMSLFMTSPIRMRLWM